MKFTVKIAMGLKGRISVFGSMIRHIERKD